MEQTVTQIVHTLVTRGCLIVLQIYGNVANIFGKFVKEGKATIRFKQPTHDLCLSKVSCTV